MLVAAAAVILTLCSVSHAREHVHGVSFSSRLQERLICHLNGVLVRIPIWHEFARARRAVNAISLILVRRRIKDVGSSRLRLSEVAGGVGIGIGVEIDVEVERVAGVGIAVAVGVGVEFEVGVEVEVGVVVETEARAKAATKTAVA